MTFSQRMGIVKVRDTIQLDSLDRETRNAIWNLLSPVLAQAKDFDMLTIFKDIWTDFYKEATDTYPRDGILILDNRYTNDFYYDYIRKTVISGEWYKCLDFIEFIVSDCNRKRWDSQFYNILKVIRLPDAQMFNAVFEKNMVGYRFVGGEIAPITNEQEVNAIESTINNSKPAVKELLTKALVHLSDRKHPDYAKSVECSISAVESQCRILCKASPGEKVTLGQLLKNLENKGLKLHPALKKAYDALYGFASNADGIRHAGSEPSDVDQAFAKYMLVSCSAFVNYLISKGS